MNKFLTFIMMVKSFNKLEQVHLDLANYDYIFIDRRDDVRVASKKYFDQIMNYYNLPYSSSSFVSNVYGKPHLRGQEFNFSISHSGDIICLAVTLENSIGVDCEKIIEIDNMLDIAKRFFTETEKDYIQNSSVPLKSFYTIWCSKEALLKYYGIGLNIPLNSFNTLSSKRIESLSSLEIEPKQKYTGKFFNCYRLVSYSLRPIIIIEGEFSEKVKGK